MKKSTACAMTVLAAATFILAGCGGGGGGTNAPTAVVPGNLIKTMPANPFSAGTVEYANFNEINRIRIAGGFGAMVDDPVMRQAATAHENYGYLNYVLANNPNPGPHNETPGYPGFTGVDPQARCNAAAVGTDAVGKITCSEVGGGVSGPLSGPPSAFNIMGGYASGAVGHLQSTLSYRNNRGGLHILEVPDGHYSSAGSGITIDLGYRSDSRAMLDSDKTTSVVGIYPFDGMTGVGLGSPVYNMLNAGIPLVLPTSILVQTSMGELNPVVTSFTLRKDGASADTPCRQVVGGEPAYGPGTEPTDAGWAILLPSVALEPNSLYSVNFAGTLNGVAISKRWSFTTGTTAEARRGG